MKIEDIRKDDVLVNVDKNGAGRYVPQANMHGFMRWMADHIDTEDENIRFPISEPIKTAL